MINPSLLNGSVGAGGTNNPSDVRLVQRLLNNWLRQTGKPPLKVDGFAGPKTQTAIAEYQRFFRGIVDGRADPGGATISSLFYFQRDLLLSYSSPLVESVKLDVRRYPVVTAELELDFDQILGVFIIAARDS